MVVISSSTNSIASLLDNFEGKMPLTKQLDIMNGGCQVLTGSILISSVNVLLLSYNLSMANHFSIANCMKEFGPIWQLNHHLVLPVLPGMAMTAKTYL